MRPLFVLLKCLFVLLPVLVLALGILILLIPSEFYPLRVPHIKKAKPMVAIPGGYMSMDIHTGRSSVDALCRVEKMTAKILFDEQDSIRTGQTNTLSLMFTRLEYNSWGDTITTSRSPDGTAIDMGATIRFPNRENLRGRRGTLVIKGNFSYPKANPSSVMKRGHRTFQNMKATVEEKLPIAFLTIEEEHEFAKWKRVRLVCRILGWSIVVVSALILKGVLENY